MGQAVVVAGFDTTLPATISLYAVSDDAGQTLREVAGHAEDADHRPRPVAAGWAVTPGRAIAAPPAPPRVQGKRENRHARDHATSRRSTFGALHLFA